MSSARKEAKRAVSRVAREARRAPGNIEEAVKENPANLLAPVAITTSAIKATQRAASEVGSALTPDIDVPEPPSIPDPPDVSPGAQAPTRGQAGTADVVLGGGGATGAGDEMGRTGRRRLTRPRGAGVNV